MKERIIQILVSLTLIAAIFVIVFVFVFKGGNISHQQFWHILLFLFIVLVTVLNLRPHWSVKKKHRHFLDGFLAQTDKTLQCRLFGDPDSSLLDSKYLAFAKIIGSPLKMKVSGNNSVEIITDGARKYDLLLRDLEKAKESIHIEYYHFGIDKGSRDIRNMLIKKAKEGVKVKFINENIANLPIIHRYYQSMKKSGVDVIRFTGIHRLVGDYLTKINYRNHRKIVVIDGKIGYTGGMNIIILS